jgi:hypothetical protein
MDGARLGVSEGTDGFLSEIVYQVMSKEELLGCNGDSHNLGYYGGPFQVSRGLNDSVQWQSTDGSAFTCRMSQEQGGPCGRVFVSVDNGVNRKCGTVFKTTLNPWSPNGSYRHVDVYVKLGERERYVQPSTSETVGGRPLELFVGFDCPLSQDFPSDGELVAEIVAGELEVRYE